MLGARDAFESQKRHDELTEAETEEQEVRKRRAEGTPCNKENFEAWRERFNQEMEAKKDHDEANAVADTGKKKKQVEKKEDKTGRVTGFLHFSGKNLEAIERAAEAAASQDLTEAERAELAIDEDLFDDDEDLDDLDFDSDDDGDDDGDDDEEEPDI